MVKLVPYKKTHFVELTSFELDETQSKFNASVYENIVERKIESITGKFPVTILNDEIPVGFFILDDSEEKLICTQNENAILLRSLSLNPKYQRKGIGKQTMVLMDEYVQNQFPPINQIVLSVNIRNENAIQLYLKTGYSHTNQIIKGFNGAQFIMVKFIN